MTEREMEDLLWEHPAMFFNEPLNQFRRQHSSPVGRSDVIFTDRVGHFLVVEIKRGRLPREAISQLHDYYGTVKKEFPDKPVELMVVANQIPPERKTALDGFNIGWREFAESKFRDVAAEVGYKFESEIPTTSPLPTKSPEVLTMAGPAQSHRWSFGEAGGTASGKTKDDQEDFFARCDDKGKAFFSALLRMLGTECATKAKVTWDHSSGFSLNFYFRRLGFVEMLWGFPATNREGKRGKNGQSLVCPFDLAKRRGVPVEFINEFGEALAAVEAFVPAPHRPSITVGDLLPSEQEHVLKVVSEFIAKAAKS